MVEQQKNLGRPKFQIDLIRLHELAGLGLTAEQIADRLGISRRCLFARMAKEPEIRGAMNEGLSEGVEFAARTLRDMARDKNLGALIFFLKTKGGFTVPKDPAVVVNMGGGNLCEPPEHMADRMIEQQQRLFEECSQSDWQNQSSF